MIPISPQTGIRLRMANRHGLIAGATGTGKTVTLKTLTERLAAAGVPVFIPDIKGDVSGLATHSPAILWSMGGASGHPMRASVRAFGVDMLARVMGLNPTQSGVLAIVHRIAADMRQPFDTLEDLRRMLAYVQRERANIAPRYGAVSTASIAAIMRGILRLEDSGGAALFGAPSLDIADLMRTAPDGRGYVSILAADHLITQPRIYSAFLLFLLSELFERLPEHGDSERPRLAFIFDEAHLIFQDAPAALIARVEQVARLIRSKGVGVYFCSQSPDDLPDAVLSQLGNRIQHAIRAFTPRDRRAVRAAAETFAPNPAVDVADAITSMGTGYALISTLRDDGTPSPVVIDRVSLPACRLGPITDSERAAVIAASPIGGKYDARPEPVPEPPARQEPQPEPLPVARGAFHFPSVRRRHAAS